MTDQIATAHSIKFSDSFWDYTIDGTAHQDRLRRYFRIPLVSHVEGNLWQGGVWPGVRLPDDFVNVINLYGLSYELGPTTTEHKLIMADSKSQGFDKVNEVARAAVDLLQDGPMLVHCQAGLNRSGLLAARMLMLMGDSASTAIDKLRKRHGAVLCNESFVNWLHGQDEHGC